MDLSVNTAQNVSINYKVAGIASRIFATTIDLLVLVGIGIVAFLITSEMGRPHRNIVQTIIFACLLLYHLLSEFFLNGQSFGKIAFKLRVIRLDGKKLTFWDCLLRWTLRLVDITCCSGVIGSFSIIATKNMQRLGDLAAGTTVIIENNKTTLHQLSRYDTAEDYQVIFPQVAVLTDKDMAILREILQEVKSKREYRLLEPLVGKIKQLTGIQTDMPNLRFIQTVLSDYIHLSKQ